MPDSPEISVHADVIATLAMNSHLFVATEKQSAGEFWSSYLILPGYLKAIDRHITLVIGDTGAGKTKLYQAMVFHDGQLRLNRSESASVTETWVPGLETWFPCDAEVRDPQQIADLWTALLICAIPDWCLSPDERERWAVLRVLSRNEGNHLREVFSRLREQVAGLLGEVNRRLSEDGQVLVVAYDGLESWLSLDDGPAHASLSGLIRLWSETLQAYASIRPKIFVSGYQARPLPSSGLEDLTRAVRGQIELRWSDDDLLMLVVMRLLAWHPRFVEIAKNRQCSLETIGTRSVPAPGSSLVEWRLFINEAFGLLFGQQGSSGHVWKWIVSNIRDSNGVSTPRVMLKLLHHTFRMLETLKDSGQSLTPFQCLQQAHSVVSAEEIESSSEIRWLPWIKSHIYGIKIPAERAELLARIKRPWNAAWAEKTGYNADQALETLVARGYLSLRSDGTIDAPDLYRHGFGFQRTSGTKVGMNTDHRDRLNAATARLRLLLEHEFQQQLEGDFDIFLDGKIGSQAPRHLDARARLVRGKLLAALHHKRAAGCQNDESVMLLLREAAFTALNRICALKLGEARGLVQECVSKGTESAGFREFALLAPGLTALGDNAYRLYLESLCDELHLELGSLFDRREPGALLWPRWSALQELLGIVNAAELAPVWREDETIGWIYQYFNSTAERRAMRAASSAPRNSRELAVRNQFFTPRYVVRFLIDNTLGRQWWLATGGVTNLNDRCSLLMVRPDDIAPRVTNWRDPRTIRLLDPACGSMHFGLYAFDVFQIIYAEAWSFEISGGVLVDADGAKVPAMGASYPDQAAFLRDVPRLILAHNIHGVDIDPRAVQVSRLALWLRAQRAWQDAQVPVDARPAIECIQVLAAIAPPGDDDARQALAQQMPAADRKLLTESLKVMDGLDEMGVLLRLEREVRRVIQRVLFETEIINDIGLEALRWREAEASLFSVLTKTADAGQMQGRLVAEDALSGLRLFDLIREPFDVVVMNPPFGAASASVKEQLTTAYPRSKHDLLAMFVERGIELLRPGGRLGAITSRTGFFLSSYKSWREEVLLGLARPEVMADLGFGVMDDAMVEAAAYVLERVKPTNWATV